MQPTTSILFLTLNLIISNKIFCNCNYMLGVGDLFQQGKSFLSRSVGKRKFVEPDTTKLFPEHRDENFAVEIPDDFPFFQGQLRQNFNPTPPTTQPQQQRINDKGNNGYILYRTDIIENDNMDLYSLIGGISFASLLATTLYVLGRNRRNNNSNNNNMNNINNDQFFKSLDIMKRVGGSFDVHNNHKFMGNDRHRSMIKKGRRKWAVSVSHAM